MSTRIYVMTHKPFLPPNDPTYSPLHVGRAKAADLGFAGDDTGDNISAKNNRYGELTGVYWIWKNSDFTGNVGVCHYRRYFIDREYRPLCEEEFDRILKEYDIIVSQAMETDLPYREYYNEAHDPKELILLREACERVFPEDLPVLDETLNERTYYFGNLCVMKREEFNAYAGWLFSLMTDVEERIDLTGYDEYHGRVYGFLSEQLLRTWTKKRGLKVYECPVGIAGEKAETTEFKLAMKQLVKMKQIDEADRMFHEILKVRPDIAQESADLSGEVPTIEKLLYIISNEQKRKLTGLLDHSTDLPTLIAHYGKVLEILRNREEGTAKAKEYFRETHVTDLMLKVMRMNETI